MFEQMPAVAPDPLWKVVEDFHADPRPERMNLVIGVYRDDALHTPVMSAVVEAERRLARAAESKQYRGLSGNEAFNREITRLLIPDPAVRDRATTVQSVAGSGALRLLADLVAATRPEATVLVGTPTYVNHLPILAAAGLRVRRFRHLDDAGRADREALLAAVAGARPGDVLLLQGCCHNPTGTDLPAELWPELADALVASGVVPFIDLAYYGLGHGLDADLAGMRTVLDRVPEALLAVSGSKAFGLYDERVGAAIVTSDPAQAPNVRRTLEGIARVGYSVPPDHGASVVTTILRDEELTARWQAELAGMQRRIAGHRARLVDTVRRLGGGPEWDAVADQIGMFSLLPLDPEQMRRLRRDHAVYGADTGRINVAGIASGQLDRLAEAVARVSEATEDRPAREPAHAG